MFLVLIDGTYIPAAAAQMIIGDFNTGLHGIDESGSTFYCAEQFPALPKTGLIASRRSRNPDDKMFSCYWKAVNGFQIDHVFTSTAADNQIKDVYYDHMPRETRVTDHPPWWLNMPANRFACVTLPRLLHHTARGSYRSVQWLKPVSHITPAPMHRSSFSAKEPAL